MKTVLNKNWNLRFDDKVIPANVPGDITIDLYHAGLVSDPYIAMNYKDSAWVGHKDFTYECEFDVTEEMMSFYSITINFKGIDLFSKIFINGKELGNTNNAFLAYKYEIKDLVKVGKNILKVEMTSTLNEMDKIDTTGYFAIFNLPRMFVRKAQCHFGWDWAPKICAYGIIDEVYIETKNKYQIDNVQVISDEKGNASFHVKLNYINKNFVGPEGEILTKGEPTDNDKIRLMLEKEPNSGEFDTYEIDMMGRKNFFAINKKNFKLWWPNGYGEHPLYNYKIELVRGGIIQDIYEGRMAFRSVLLKEEPKPGNLLGMDLYINNTKIFLKGSDWVPPECFTGVMSDDKYYKLIKLAKDMNANMLRVWGGGAYEKDVFFDLCDENGILTWQDICLACADIPDDKQDFVDNLLNEVKYQVIRLRNHPSLVYWCGGNEKTGTYGNCITHGDFLVNVTLYGLISDLDGTRPYRRQSPHAYSDIGNDQSSGDSHRNSFEPCLFDGISTMRSKIASGITPFVSECAVMGPASSESMRKIFPSDQLWPMNDMWADRLMDNPYAAIRLDFPHRELKYAEDLYGKVTGFEDFISKASNVHAEALRAEAEYVRAHSNITGAFMNWMFNDIWPSGTWSIVDYWGEPKQAYYQLKRSFEPVLVSFYEDKNKVTHLFVDNGSAEDVDLKIECGVKEYDGKVLESKIIKVSSKSISLNDFALEFKNIPENAYIFAKYAINGVSKNIKYSPIMFSKYSFKNDYSYEACKLANNVVELTITAESFVKSLFIHFKDNFKYEYSDNYLDLEKGETVKVVISSEEDIDLSELKFNSFEG